MTSDEKNLMVKVIDILFENGVVETDAEWDAAKASWNEFKETFNKTAPEITEKGTAILDYLREHKDERNTASSIGEALDWSGKTVSGAMRKLVSGGYVIRHDTKPISYTIAD